MSNPSDTNYYAVVVFPADGRAPHVADMPFSTAGPDPYAYQIFSPQVGIIVHPEILMEYIADNISTPAYQFMRIAALDCMTSSLSRPYTVFYPVISRDGMPFPVNKCVAEIQQGRGLTGHKWRGDLVVAAYSDDTFSTLVSANISDFAVIKNFFLTHRSPISGK